MRLMAELFRAAIGRLRGGEMVVFGADAPEFREWLQQRSLPAALVQFLLENSLSRHVSFNGVGGMWTPADIIEWNEQEEALYPAGLIAVGSATNGDPIVIHFLEGAGLAGFASHDLLCDEESQNFYLPVARSIGEMLHGMTTVEDFPRDYWDAKDNPILFDAEVIKPPLPPCLGRLVEPIIDLFKGRFHGRLSEHSEIEERLRIANQSTIKVWGDEESNWIPFASVADAWVNDMQTVVFDFWREYDRIGIPLAHDVLRLAPDRLQYFEIAGRLYVRMWWKRDRAQALPTQSAKTGPDPV